MNDDILIEDNTYSTGKKKTALKVTICVVIAIIVLGLVAFLVYHQSQKYTPPQFDITAQQGVPTYTDDSFSYVENEYDFTFGVNGVLSQNQNELKLDFVNPEQNNVWLMIAVFDNDGKKEFARSGIIKPGEYIESIKTKKELPEQVKYKVYAFEPDTYLSEGAVVLSGIKTK